MDDSELLVEEEVTAIPESPTALRTFERCRPKVKMMLLRIQKQLQHFQPIEDLVHEAQQKWIQCFPDIYEEDSQYLKYMFVVMKNRMKDIRRLEYRYQNTHVSDPAKISRGLEDSSTSHVQVWNEMAADHKEEMPVDNCIRKEFIEMIEAKLTKDLHIKIFRLMTEGRTHKQIAEELGFSTGHIVQIKTKIIWPIAKEVMRIPEDTYDVLIDSGRIYFSG